MPRRRVRSAPRNPFSSPVVLSAMVGAVLAVFPLSTRGQGANGDQDGISAIPRTGSREPIELPGQMNLDDLVELVTKRLGLSVQYQREALRKPVSLRLNTAVSDDELWHIVTAVLEGQGLVVVQTTQAGVYRVVPIQAAANENQRVSLPGHPANLGEINRSSYVSLVVRLRSASADDAAKSLAPLLTPSTGLARPIGDGGLLLISDVRRRVDQALDVLELIDGPPDPVTTFVMDFEVLTSADAAKLLESVWSARQAASGRPSKASVAGGGPTGNSSPRVIPLVGERRAMVICPASAADEVRRTLKELDQREPRETRAYASNGVPPDQLAASIRQILDLERPGPVGSGAASGTAGEGVRVATDKLTGMVMVSAGSRDHARITGLVDRLNAMPAASRQALRSFAIKNRDAAELSQTLRDLLGAGGLSVVSETGPSQTDTPVSAPPGALPVPSAKTSGSRNDPAGPAAATADLRITVDTVTNTIMAVGEPSMLAQLEALIQTLDRRQPQVMLDVSLVTLSNSEAFNFGVELQKRFEEGRTTVNLASLFGLASATNPLQGGTGFSGTVIRVDDYQMVVRALETLSNGRSVSLPKILVANNAKSTLRSVQRQPFTSINASDTVATTSFGGTQDAGTTVTVKPQITEGDHLVLEYSVELSAFTGPPIQVQGGGIIPPPSQQNTVDGTVTLPDGFTVVLGGLTSASEGRSNARVPGIGAIPILGALFGTTSDTDTSSRFFVFIRATILRDTAFEDLRNIGAADLTAAQVDDGIPDLQPRWIE